MDKRFPERIRDAFGQEPFARMLGIRAREVRPGYALVEMTVKDEHLNLHRTAHGGIVFSVIDAAFELASNSHGTVAMALSVTLNFLKAVQAGDTIVAEASEVDLTRRTGNYRFLVKDQAGDLIAHGQGLVHRKDTPLGV
jgi:acyl-CoA thioesterase